MKFQTKLRLPTLVAIIMTTLPGRPILAANQSEGDEKLSCEAILCLSTGQRPGACAPALERYFSIKKRKLADTIRARKSFLEICPTGSKDNSLAAVIDMIVHSAGRCDATALNAELSVAKTNSDMNTWSNFVIGNQLPHYCKALEVANGGLGGALPVYIGVPENGGFWAAPEDAIRAQKVYDSRHSLELPKSE